MRIIGWRQLLPSEQIPADQRPQDTIASFNVTEAGNFITIRLLLIDCAGQ